MSVTHHYNTVERIHRENQYKQCLTNLFIFFIYRKLHWVKVLGKGLNYKKVFPLESTGLNEICNRGFLPLTFIQPNPLLSGTGASPDNMHTLDLRWKMVSTVGVG